MKTKKAQEEMVGFVMIVLLVAIALVVMLGIYLRSEASAPPAESAEIAQFLSSAVRITTQCGPESFPDTLNEVASDCARSPDNQCTDQGNQTSCQALEETMQELIELSWNINESSLYTGYRFDLFQQTDRGANATAQLIQGDTSKPNSIAAEVPYSNQGFIMRLEIFLS